MSVLRGVTFRKLGWGLLRVECDPTGRYVPTCFLHLWGRYYVSKFWHFMPGLAQPQPDVVKEINRLLAARNSTTKISPPHKTHRKLWLTVLMLIWVVGYGLVIALAIRTMMEVGK